VRKRARSGKNQTVADPAEPTREQVSQAASAWADTAARTADLLEESARLADQHAEREESLGRLAAAEKERQRAAHARAAAGRTREEARRMRRR
jgi:hypothetical protein